MAPPNIIVYDAEIKNAIPNKDGHIDHGITYCKGWHDHAKGGKKLKLKYKVPL
jgi:hypothetical protein